MKSVTGLHHQLTGFNGQVTVNDQIKIHLSQEPLVVIDKVGLKGWGYFEPVGNKIITTHHDLEVLFKHQDCIEIRPVGEYKPGQVGLHTFYDPYQLFNCDLFVRRQMMGLYCKCGMTPFCNRPNDMFHCMLLQDGCVTLRVLIK